MILFRGDEFEEMLYSAGVRYTLIAEVDGAKIFEGSYEDINEVLHGAGKAEQMVIEKIDQLLVDKEARLIKKATGYNIN